VVFDKSLAIVPKCTAAVSGLQETTSFCGEEGYLLHPKAV